MFCFYIDGKYLIIIGNTNRSNDSQKIQLGPFTHSKSSNETNHCLQFWYSTHGEGVGKLTIIHQKINDSQDDDSLIFSEKDQGRFIEKQFFFFSGL